MLTKTKLLRVNLTMFDDGAGTGATAQTEGGQPSTPLETGDNEVKVLYGIQPEEENPAAGEPKEKSPEEKRKAYDEYVRGEAKEFYTEDIQKIINRRFRETKSLQEELEAYKDATAPLMKKYGVDNVKAFAEAIRSDNAVYQGRADSEGLTVEQIQERDSILAENERLRTINSEREKQEYVDNQYRTWMTEAAEVKKTYPEFDIRVELNNQKFGNLLRQGLSVMDAYEVVHLAEIKSRAAKESEKAVTENIKSRGSRPTESGASNPAGVIVKSDPDKFTDEDIAEVIRRARAGEKISF